MNMFCPFPPALPESADWCVYLLRCADGTLYCGSTNRPSERFAAHRSSKGARYTRARGAAAMRVVVCCVDKSGALKAEYRIKKMTRAQKLALWVLGTEVVCTAGKAA